MVDGHKSLSAVTFIPKNPTAGHDGRRLALSRVSENPVLRPGGFASLSRAIPTVAAVQTCVWNGSTSFLIFAVRKSGPT